MIDIDPPRRQAVAYTVALAGLGLALAAAQLQGQRQALTGLLGILATLAVVVALFQNRRIAIPLLGLSALLIVGSFISIWTGGPPPQESPQSRTVGTSELPSPSPTEPGPGTAISDSAPTPTPTVEKTLLTQVAEPSREALTDELELHWGPIVDTRTFGEDLHVSATDFVSHSGYIFTLRTTNQICTATLYMNKSVAAPGPKGVWYRITLLEEFFPTGEVTVRAEQIIGTKRPKASVGCRPVD